MKVYYTQMNVGRAKYTVNYHDGKKTHEDGSTFYDIAIFKNKEKQKKFIKELIKDGYEERLFLFPITSNHDFKLRGNKSIKEVHEEVKKL